MSLFRGLASFSPAVSPTIKLAWVNHGGRIAEKSLEEQPECAMWYFCDGIDDSQLEQLWKRRLVVFHADWVLDATTSHFLLPLAKYVLDGRFNSLKDRGIYLQDDLGSGVSAHSRLKLSSKSNYCDHAAVSRRTRPSELKNSTQPYDSDPKTTEGFEINGTIAEVLEESETDPKYVRDTVRREPCVVVGPARIPRVDSRRVSTPKNTKGSVHAPIAQGASATAANKIIPSTHELKHPENLVSVDHWKSMLITDNADVTRIGVSDALFALTGASIENVAPFVNGGYHLDKQFIYIPSMDA